MSTSVYECQGDEFGKPDNEVVVATYNYHLFAYERIILRCILEKDNGKVLTELICMRYAGVNMTMGLGGSQK
jgi:hypothetical protein